MPDWIHLTASCKGKIYFQNSPGFRENLFSFNGYFQKTPLAVLVAESESDIIQAIQFASQNSIRISILNGGHSTIGSGLNSGGLVISMQKLNTIHLDPLQKTALIGAGALAQDVDKALNPHQLAIPLGDCPVVGIAGLTLGGGNGFLSRSLGLTCDHLLEARIINMLGEVLLCNENQNRELFYALRGAGQGNFGVITSLKFRLSPIPEKVAGGNICWPLDMAGKILPLYDEMLRNAPEELNLYLRINQEMGPMIKIYGMYNGAAEIGMPFFESMLQWATPIYQNINRYSYTEMQQINATTIVHGPCFQWKNGLLKGPIPEALVSLILQAYSKCPTPYCRINIDTLSGKIHRPDSENAFAHRNSDYILSVMGVWFEDKDKEEAVQWANASMKLLQPYFTGSMYANYADPTADNLSERYYGERALAIEELCALHNLEKLLIGTLNAESVDFF